MVPAGLDEGALAINQRVAYNMFRFLTRTPKAADGFQIAVHAPLKTSREYVFSLDIGDPNGGLATTEIGIRDASFPIPHAPVWDTYYPLMFIIRRGGPLFGIDGAKATIKFDYPASLPVVDFFVERARYMGVSIDVASTTKEITLDAQTSGDLLLFGGGKDSRLLLGMLRELGDKISVISARGAYYAADINGALIYDTVDWRMPSRIVPALMTCPKNVYHGAALGEVHETTPWHQYMDISTPHALSATSQLLKRIGVDTTFHVPLAVLPYNIVQRILARRYPELYKNQKSVKPHSKTNKALHIALSKRYHGLDYRDGMSAELFDNVARRFIAEMVDSPDKIWGHRHHYEVIAREIRALLYRLSRTQEISLSVPDDWDEDWIDRIHTYANPGVEECFIQIYRAFADELDTSESKLPVPLAVIAQRQVAPKASISKASGTGSTSL